MEREVVIVGGGVGGLATAALLAEDGLDVLLLERRQRLGGRAASFQHKPGYIVDWGIHMCRYGQDGEAAETLRRLGVELDFKSPASKYHIYENGKLKTTLGKGKDLLSLSSIGTMLKFLLKIGDDVEDLLDTPVNKWISENTQNKELEKFFWMLSTSLLISPHDKYDASFGEMIRTLRGMIRAGEGGAYPEGGWKTIIDNLKEFAEEQGAEIRTETEVDRVIVENETVQGVKIGEETIKAENVVLGIRHQKIEQLIDPDHLTEDYLEKSKKLTPTAGISFDIGTSKKVTDLNGLILSTELPLLGMITSNIDPSISPPGKQLMTFLFVHTPEEMKDKKFAKQKIEEYREVIHQIIPDLEGNKEWERVLRMKCVDGTALTTDQHYKKRPEVETPIENLYFASDTCGVPGGGGDISFRAARKCADLIY